MRRLIALLTTWLIVLSACCTMGVRFSPQYQGVDPKLQGLYNEYEYLSSENHITFKHKVTMGFTTLEGDTIGVCHYGQSWREIDIDLDFWKHADPNQRAALVFHELTHCLCGRDHDYGDGTPYPEKEQARIAEAMAWQKTGGPKPGRFDEDACPTSLMYPIILGSECILHHYDQYVHEMFNRCKPF